MMSKWWCQVNELLRETMQLILLLERQLLQSGVLNAIEVNEAEEIEVSNGEVEALPVCVPSMEAVALSSIEPGIVELGVASGTPVLSPPPVEVVPRRGILRTSVGNSAKRRLPFRMRLSLTSALRAEEMKEEEEEEEQELEDLKDFEEREEGEEDEEELEEEFHRRRRSVAGCLLRVAICIFNALCCCCCEFSEDQ